MEENFFQRIVCFTLVLLTLNMILVPTFAENLPRETILLEDPEDNPVPELLETPKTIEFSCSTPETDPARNVLLPNEVQKLRRKTELDNKGFSVDNINGGRGENTEREELENSLVVQKAEDGEAFVNELPNTKMDTGEFSQWFNKYISGPFAFGVSLEDTIRIGQCRGLSRLEAAERGCPVEDVQLSYRNSGEGIVENFKTVWGDVKEIFTGEETGQFSAEETENLQVKIAAETDMNSLQSKSFQRTIEQIPNSVRTEDFVANMATTGDDSKSLISIYSMFDKYFNSWFSTEMVVSTFGPTLVGQAKRYAGWMSRRGWPWSMGENTFTNWFRREHMAPDTLLGNARLQRMVTRTDKYGFGDAWTKGIESTEWDSGYAFIKGGSFRKTVNEWSKPGAYLDSIDDPIKRGEFFKQIKDLRGVGHTNKALMTHASGLYDDAARQFGRNSPEAQAALIDYAKTNSKLMILADGKYLKLDASELWVKEEINGLYNVAVKQKGIENFVPLNGDSKHIGLIQKGFINDTWKNAEFPYETTGDALRFYKVSSTGEFLDDIPIDDLRKNFSRYIDKMAKTEKGDLIKIDSASIDYIAKEAAGTGKVKIYAANWKEIAPETPLKYAQRLTSSRGARVSTNLPDNMDRLYNVLVEKNFAGQNRRYYNILDKAFAQEQDILKSYFSIKGGAKWTIMPLLYWQGKRGFGFEGLSAFQLPDSWKEVQLYTEDNEIFDDAFIDILAQHGSDEGEIFSQVLNKLPWKMALNYVSEQFNPVDGAYQSMTSPLSGWRRKVENVAYFTSTRNDCATCGITLTPRILSQSALEELQVKGRGEAVISFNAEQDMRSYFLEDIIDDKAKEEGTTLIAFGHHTNIRGESIGGEEVAKDIDLIQAKKDNELCQDKVKEIGFGFLGDNPQRVAGILAFGESLGYVAFFWSGIIGSVLQQTLITPKLQDCVDDVDGYFLHMYAAYDESKEDVESANEKSSGKAADIVKSFSNDLLGKPAAPVIDDDDDDKPLPLRDAEGNIYTRPERIEEEDDDRPGFVRPWEEESADQLSFWDRAKQQISDQAEKLSAKAKSSEILQLEVETMGETNGIAFFSTMFFFWFKGNTQQAIYDDYSRSVYEDTKNDVSVIVDKEDGSISVKEKGKPAEKVITSEDQVRLSGPDGRVPAEVIPQRIGSVTLPSGPGVPMFEMGWKGNLQVLDPNVLDCIKRNIEEQTGIPLQTNTITDAFGSVDAIVTDTYPTITASVGEKAITANGSPREIVFGDNAKVVVMSDLNTTMSNGKTVPVGNFRSIQFKNGVILLKPGSQGELGELLIWLRHHEKSILTPNDVKGLKAIIADDLINPETGCPEPAINLEAIPNFDAGKNSAITERVANFNKSLKKMGPFQTFDTDRHRFIFYTEKTDSTCNVADEGCCQDRVTIIDKETGDVYDQAIIGGLNQTPTGVEFTTEDGKDHTLDFSADNGIPKVSYNDMAPETLTMARGPNGAFWYDPEEELWRPYNAQLLPLIEAFKTRGFDTRHREDCSSTTLPGSNTMNIEFGGAAETPFNLPSIPVEPIALLLFVISFFAAICIARTKIEQKFNA